ncbi:hypothetical protein [Sphingomonas sp. M1-B02]|uniref:hypothetical protein n=1 Tax=Sphingomonas sp. M1-B02 TaxID=3114300 RepID=UPI00223F97F2|nr:hypothetical protein [Sphingomonas sp. S6-11]UZK64866.1 hypothetical protein OKW87_10030 [Sphingomonas sp. S6-11]
MSILLLALAQAVSAPDPEALRLGRRLAETGTLAALLPIVTVKEREELLREHPEWSDADKAAFRATADEVAKAATARLMEASGRAYARILSLPDLRALVAFNEGAAATRWRAATPAAVLESMGAMGGFDYKKEARAAFCAKSGKGCD